MEVPKKEIDAEDILDSMPDSFSVWLEIFEFLDIQTALKIPCKGPTKRNLNFNIVLDD